MSPVFNTSEDTAQTSQIFEISSSRQEKNLEDNNR